MAENPPAGKQHQGRVVRPHRQAQHPDPQWQGVQTSRRAYPAGIEKLPFKPEPTAADALGQPQLRHQSPHRIASSAADIAQF